MKNTGALAHSLEGCPRDQWEPLGTHLEDVALLAAERAAKFGAADWGRTAGLLHDIGKLSEDFQSMLNGAPAHVDHSSAGARIAAERYGICGHLLAYAIAGHHAGLADGTGDGKPKALEKRLNSQSSLPAIDDWEKLITPPSGLPSPPITQKPGLTGPLSREGLSVALFTRMVFSALIDGDRIATEAFYRGAERRSPADRGNWRNLADLKSKLDAYMADKQTSARAKANEPGQRRVLDERAKILGAARRAASLAKGLFSLTVPTGGGKTLASLTFALDHAIEYGLDRIIYVIPFTSIIEQTAGVFRDVFGAELADHVVEHHSASREDEALAKLEGTKGESAFQAGERLRFALENWDAPIIVTTVVQFFESLFSNKTSRCRKLHNIVNSVVIFDEAQTLPLRFLRPTVAAIEELTLNYGVSAVLCTATQPAISAANEDGAAGIRGGLEGVREIVERPADLYRSLRRVTVRACRKLAVSDLVEELAAAEQALCIVGTRKQARELFKELRTATGESGVFHLSALMCPAHRSQKLKQIRDALGRGPCRVIATTVVEAGVDIDFPRVWRQMAGLDSIAQAAGRCNREGKRVPEDAIVHLFEVDDWKPIRELAANADAAREALRWHGDDPLSPAAIKAYFNRLYRTQAAGAKDGLDQHAILGKLRSGATQGNLPFAEVADLYRLIDTVMEPVIIPLGDAPKLIADLAASSLAPSAIRAVARKLQPYTVNVPKDAFGKLVAAGRIKPINEHRFETQFMQLRNEAYANLYSDDLGFDWGDATFRTAESNLF